MGNYDCGKCGAYVGIMNMARQRDYRDKITHITCPQRLVYVEPEQPTTPVRFRVKLRAFCREAPGRDHTRCSGIQMADDGRSAHVCSCECHTTDIIPPTLDASES